MTDKLERRAPRLLRIRPKADRRSKLITFAVGLAMAGACYGLGWVGVGGLVVLAVIETLILLVVPTRENPEALREAEAIGLVEQPAEDG